VTFARRGEQVVGALHLTPHHLIFSHTPPADDAAAGGTKPRPRELWITYPIISFCTLKPSPVASRQPSSIRIRCRDFTFICFYFSSDSRAREVFETIKSWTCKLGRIEKLYAFSYKPQAPEKEVNGWNIYDPRKEWKRLGVCDDGPRSSWRISKINVDYGVENVAYIREAFN
jgi:myotubularin-related protein 6/7/8